MRVLAIETSCDETAVALLECEWDGSQTSFTILGDALYSQADKHAEYGGVYPALAKREHQANLASLATEALKQADALKEGGAAPEETALAPIRDEEFKKSVRAFLEAYANPNVDLIAVTEGPGLEPALWTGINFAEALGNAWNTPVMGIDHMEGHIVSALLKKLAPGRYALQDFGFPLLALLISGGHTELVLMKEWFSYEHVGMTKDDALGEAFDKVARLLDLAYPGGPKVAESAARSRERGGTDIKFPRPMLKDDTCDFSFSGLKTAVLYKMRSMDKISEQDKEEIAQAFEDAAREVVVEKSRRALELTKAKAFAVGGGVSANAEIRKALKEMVSRDFPETSLFFPEAELTGDNAIMIGAAGYLRSASGKKPPGSLTALGSRSLSSQ